MSSIVKNRTAIATFAALALGAAPAASQSRIALPAGTVIIVRTQTALQSASAKAGQIFETVVEESVGLNDLNVIPAGSKIRGVVAVATPATRQQSGMIDVHFDQLIHTDGTIYQMQGKLTSTDTTERRQINANPNQHVVFVGGRGGIGATIAAAGAGRSSNSILSALGDLLSEGRDVSVPAGTQIAVELERALTLRGRDRVVAFSGGTIYTAADRVTAAQKVLTRAGYYRGPINGTLDDATRRALFEYQVDRGLRATGNLDGRTAQALGLNVTAGLAGTVMTADAASALRRDAQTLVARYRAEIGASAVGRLDANRGYTQADLELWFALSAFADNASLYEQVIRGASNQDAMVLAGKTLAAAMRRVDTAIQSAQASTALRNGWSKVRAGVTPLESGS
jgi:peptidoglycan hydrolase-like protein with peptidoglycan-binding domain